MRHPDNDIQDVDDDDDHKDYDSCNDNDNASHYPDLSRYRFVENDAVTSDSERPQSIGKKEFGAFLESLSQRLDTRVTKC